MNEEDLIQKACEFLKGWARETNKDIQEVCPKIAINEDVLIRRFLKAMKQ